MPLPEYHRLVHVPCAHRCRGQRQIAFRGPDDGSDGAPLTLDEKAVMMHQLVEGLCIALLLVEFKEYVSTHIFRAANEFHRPLRRDEFKGDGTQFQFRPEPGGGIEIIALENNP